MKRFISRAYRRGMLIFISIILIISINVVDSVKKIQSIDKTQIVATVDENLRNGFEQVLDFTKTDRYYDVSYSDDTQNSQIILTSDLTKIDTTKDYKIIAHSPLILMMKQSKKLNNLLISNSDKGFLISDSKIKNNNEDKINCDFTKVVDAINDGGNWSNLGADENKEIIVYCPKLDTNEGRMFKEFLVRIYNKGLNESNNEIENKIKMFFESENVIQTDIYHKLELLKDNVSENIIFVGFENDLLKFYQKHNQEFNFIYPQKTILKNLYLQFNSDDKDLRERFLKEDFWIGQRDINRIFYCGYFYRFNETGSFFDLNYSCNVQAGIDTFEN